jgi:DNA-binding response OmpR family regulator
VKVLHIDDNKDITNLISELIELQGFDYFVTNNPRDGLNRIKNEKFDVILLDMHMPELSGIDVIEELEREKILKDQKIVIQRSELLKKEGIHYCLKKPIEFNELLSAIRP